MSCEGMVNPLKLGPSLSVRWTDGVAALLFVVLVTLALLVVGRWSILALRAAGEFTEF